MKTIFLSLTLLFIVVGLSCAALPGVSVVENQTWFIIENAQPQPDESEAKFTIYLSQNILNIKYTKPQDLANSEVIVFDLLGKEVIRKHLESTPLNQIPVPQQNTCFIIRINYAGKVYTKKIISGSNS